MKYQVLLVIFEKAKKKWKCCLLQIIEGIIDRNKDFQGDFLKSQSQNTE